MSFIVLEGLDGSGKSTQVKMLQQYFKDRGIRYKYLHFPRTESPFFGELISMFLRGDLGDLEQVHPYLVALIYAGDRNDAAKEINNWLDEKYVVLVDRYVYSNIGYQCAKLNDESSQLKLADWIKRLEFDYYKIPKPDINIFLEVPFEFTSSKLNEARKGDDRDYLNGKEDIHEADLEFQRKVKNIYHQQEKLNEELIGISCVGVNNQMLSPVNIFEKIIKKTEPYL